MTQYLLNLVSTNGLPGSTSSNFTIKYDRQLAFEDGDWDVGLISATVPNTFHNISVRNGNNKLHYYDGTSNQTKTIPDGVYSVAALNDEIQLQLGNDNIAFAADPVRLRVFLSLKNNYQVDFSGADTFRDLLGFAAQNYNTQNTKLYAPNRPSVTNGNGSFFIACDLVNGSYSRIGGAPASILFGFTFTVGQRAYQSIVPAEHVHLPLARTYVDTINVQILNQDGKVVDLNDEVIVVNLKVKKILPINALTV